MTFILLYIGKSTDDVDKKKANDLKRVVPDGCHGYHDEADRPIAAYTFDTCGQLFFPYNAKPVHISPWGYIDEPQLVRKKNAAGKGPENGPILCVFRCPICVPPLKAVMSRNKNAKKSPVF